MHAIGTAHSSRSSTRITFVGSGARRGLARSTMLHVMFCFPDEKAKTYSKPGNSGTSSRLNKSFSSEPGPNTSTTDGSP